MSHPLVDYMAFIATRRAEQLEQPLLRRIGREDEVVSAVEHEHGNRHTRREIMPVGRALPLNSA